MIAMNNSERYYIYKDNVGVDSIVNQIMTMKTVERCVQTKGKGNINGEKEMYELLSRLLKAEVGAPIESEYIKVLDEKKCISYETKTKQIIEYINNNGSLIKRPHEIIQKYNNNCINFINTILKFNTDFEFWFDDNAKKSIEHFGYLTFYIGNKWKQKNTYDDSDLYYKNITTYGKKIIMNMSIEKMKVGIGITSELSVYFRINEFKNMPFGVFGHVNLIGDIYQIKPYGVWIPN